MARLVPGAKAKHEQAVAEGQRAYDEALAEYAVRERERAHALAKASAEHEAEAEAIRARVAAQNREIDAFRARFDAGDPSAIVEYFSLVLAASSYPEDFP